MSDPLVGEKALPRASALIDHAARAAAATRLTGSHEPRHHHPALLWQALGVVVAVALTIAFFAVGPHAFGIPPAYALVAKHLVAATLITALILA